MNNGTVVITEEVMESAEQKIERLAAEIEQLMAEIKSEVDGVREVWKDENAEKYLEQFEQLEKEVPAFVASANNSGKFLGAVVKAYRENVMDPTRSAVEGRDINATV